MIERHVKLRHFLWLSGANNEHGLAKLEPSNFVQTTDPFRCSFAVSVQVSEGDPHAFALNIKCRVKEIGDAEWTTLEWLPVPRPNPIGDTMLTALADGVIRGYGLWFAELSDGEKSVSPEAIQMIVSPMLS